MCLIITTLVIVVGCSSDKQKSTASGGQSAINVKAIEASPTRIDDKINSTGTILANEEVEIRSEVDGRITKINFKEGSAVSKGELLLKINDDDLQAQLKKLKTQESLAQDDFYRKTKLLELDAISQEEFDVSKNQLEVIQADIEVVKAQIAKTEIFAPFNGMIGLRYVSPGGFVSSSTLVTTLQEIDPVKIEFTVPEKYLGKISKSTDIYFNIAGSDSTFTGKVYAIDHRIDPATRTLTVRAKCRNVARVLIPGAFAKVDILLQSIDDALVVPSQAIIPDIRGEKICLAKNGAAHFAYIKTGIRTSRTVQVVSGLNAGDTVLTTGLLQLREGMLVQTEVLSMQEVEE